MHAFHRLRLPELGGGILLAILGGCITPPPPITGEAGVRAAMPFVVPGETTREALLLRFGPPSWTFEDGRILTWRLQREDAGEILPKVRVSFGKIPWSYGLVVIFDAHGLVARFNLMEIG
jgi:hypothetical protein